MPSIRRLITLACITGYMTCIGAISATNAQAEEIVVSAASSLTNAFQAVGKAFEAQHAGDHVILNFAASDVLLAQIIQGAPADVFASADEAAMDKAVAAKAVTPDSRSDFATNSVVMVVPLDRRNGLHGLTDLTSASVKRVAYGNPASVPVGRYTRDGLQKIGLWEAVEAKGVVAENVRQALDYASRGEVDASFVFATDAAVATDKVAVVATLATPQRVSYPVALTLQSHHRAIAQSFIDFLKSDSGRAIMAHYGFGQP